MERRAIPVDTGSFGGAGQGGRRPLAVRKAGQLPAHAFAIKTARIERPANGVGQVLTADIALDLPVDVRGCAGKRRGDQSARFTECAAVFLLQVAGVLDQNGNDVVAARLQPRWIDRELLRTARIVAEEVTVEPGGKDAVVTQVHAGVRRELDGRFFACSLEVPAIPHVA